VIRFILLFALAILAYLYFTGQLGRRSAMSVDEARDILGVPANADTEAVRAAHRRLIAQVHPDKGGTAELARRVNAARDVLLKSLNRQPPGAS
jgi:hypothetical protein